MAASNRGSPRTLVTAELEAEMARRMYEGDRKKVARELGVSYNTLIRYLRKLNGGTTPKPDFDLREVADREEREYLVRRFYPDLSGNEMDRAFEWPKGTAKYLAHKLGVKHNDECQTRIRKKISAVNRERMLNLPPEDLAARSRVWKLRRRLDELRVMSGERQRTRHHFGNIGLRTSKKMYALVHLYHYHYTAEQLTLAYDEHTARRINKNGSKYIRHTETYIAQNYGIKFTPIELAPSENETNNDD